ncbi:carboxymuconolactone decarboxylase family protein, partial [Dickeya solani]
MKRIVLAAAVSLVLSEPALAKERTGGTNMPESVSSLSISDIQSVSPALARYAREDVLADLWQRPLLSPRDRSIVTVATLIARNQPAELRHYVGVALDNGVTPAEISEIITHLAFYAGWPNA